MRELLALLFVAGAIALAVFLIRSYLFYRMDLEHERTRKAAILMLCVQYLSDISKLPAGAKRDTEVDNLVSWLKTKEYWKMYGGDE